MSALPARCPRRGPRPRTAWPAGRAGRRAVSSVEFALCLPVLLGILFGTINVLSYFRNMSALERTAVSMGETISRCTAVSTQDLSNFAAEAQETVGGPPFTPLIDITGPGGAMILTAVSNAAGTTPTIAWQKVFSSAVPSYASKIGTVGNVPTGLGTFALPQGQVLIVVEVYNAFSLWGVGTVYALKGSVSTGPTPTTMYTLAMFLARAGNPASLQTVQSSSTPICGT